MRSTARVVAVGAAGLALGALTSWAQGFLPDAWSSLANSASGWTIVTVLLVAACRPQVPVAALLGAVGFVTLVLGYTAGSSLRGLTYDPTFWGAVGVVVGPLVGVAVAWVLTPTRPSVRALGAGGIAGVLIGEGTYGLTVVADSTSPVWWSVAIALGLLLLTGVAVRMRSVWSIVLELVVALVVAVGLVSAYQVLS